MVNQHWLLRGLMTGDGFDMFVANGADEVLLVTAFQKGQIESGGLHILAQNSNTMLYPEAVKMRWDWLRSMAVVHMIQRSVIYMIGTMNDMALTL